MVIPSLAAYDRAYVERFGLFGFAKLAWPLVEPATAFVDNWHLRLVASGCERVSRGEVRNLVINIPPATGKSLFVDVFWPAWDWITRPDRAWINASFDQGLTTRDANRLMTIVRSPWYVERWGHRLPPEPAALASREYETLQGGFRFSTSVNGKGTGRHADIQSINDPLKPKDVMGGSTVVKRALLAANEWFRNTMSTRLRDPRTSARVITMQRLHQLDLAGEAIDSGEYELLCFPMRYNPALHTPGDPRTKPGELLWPERYPEAVVKKLETAMGSAVNAAQFGQNPVAEGGQIFKADTFRFAGAELLRTVRKYADRTILSGDLAFKGKDGSDFVCMGAWAQKGKNFYLLPGVVNKRLGFTATVKAFEQLASDNPLALERLIEDKANGPAVEDHLKGKLGVTLVEPKGGKETRAHAVQPMFEEGIVFFPERGIDPVIDEMVDPRKGQLVMFPKGANDDFVDMLTQALIHLRGEMPDYSAAMQQLAKDPWVFARR